MKKESTSPKGLLLSAFIVSFTILSLPTQMKNISPQYTTFGSQSFFDSVTMKYEKCSLQMINMMSSCTMSVIASMLNK